MTIYGRSEELVSRCVEFDLAEPESLASLGGSAPGLFDGILSLCKLYGPVAEFLNWNAQEVTDVSLIINGEVVRACSQVHDDGINRASVGTEDDAVVDVDEEDHCPAVVKTWIEGAWLETDFLHALVYVFVPYTTGLLLPIHVAHQLECVCFP